MDNDTTTVTPCAPDMGHKVDGIREGVLAALWLPTDKNGRVKRDALATHIKWLKQCGIHGVLALGSTAEFIRMTLPERTAALEVVAELADPLPVIVNISSIRLDEVVALGKVAERLNMNGVAMMPPFFYPLSQADMLEFFLRAADQLSLPNYLYNFPRLTGNRIDIETISAFADKANMAGFKQSGDEFSYHRELIQLGKEKDFSVFSGSDLRLPEVFALGAAGAIGGLVNIVPELMVSIFNICRQGGEGDLESLSKKMGVVGEIIDRLTFPLNVAAGIEARGFDPGCVKHVVSPASLQIYDSIVSDLREHFNKWNLTEK